MIPAVFQRVASTPPVDAEIILDDINRVGVSTGWTFTLEELESVGQILSKRGVAYVDDIRGTWALAKPRWFACHALGEASFTIMTFRDIHRDDAVLDDWCEALCKLQVGSTCSLDLGESYLFVRVS
jgi:hypothetical protein